MDSGNHSEKNILIFIGKFPALELDRFKETHRFRKTHRIVNLRISEHKLCHITEPDVWKTQPKLSI